MDTIDLNGMSGDDIFVVRSFVRVIRDGILTPPDVGQLNLKGASKLSCWLERTQMTRTCPRNNDHLQSFRSFAMDSHPCTVAGEE